MKIQIFIVRFVPPISEDEQRGATMIVSFASGARNGARDDEVIDYVNEMDDDDWDIELTPEMLTSVAGGKRCA